MKITIKFLEEHGFTKHIAAGIETWDKYVPNIGNFSFNPDGSNMPDRDFSLHVDDTSFCTIGCCCVDTTMQMDLFLQALGIDIDTVLSFE